MVNQLIGYPSSFVYAEPYEEDTIKWLDLSLYKWQLRIGYSDVNAKSAYWVILGDVGVQHRENLQDLGFECSEYGLWSRSSVEDTTVFLNNFKTKFPQANLISLKEEPVFFFDVNTVFHDWVECSHEKDFKQFTTWHEWQQKFFLTQIMPDLNATQLQLIQKIYFQHLSFYDKHFPEIRKLKKLIQTPLPVQIEAEPVLNEITFVKSLLDIKSFGDASIVCMHWLRFCFKHCVNEIKSWPAAVLNSLKEDALKILCLGSIAYAFYSVTGSIEMMQKYSLDNLSQSFYAQMQERKLPTMNLNSTILTARKPEDMPIHYSSEAKTVLTEAEIKTIALYSMNGAALLSENKDQSLVNCQDIKEVKDDNQCLQQSSSH